MASIINASTTAGIVSTADTSGNLALQANGTTIATAQSTGLNLASTGLVFSDSTTQTSGSGVAKAWVNFNGTSGASPVIRASYNMSSVTRNSTGDYTLNFTNAMVNANYALSGMCQYQTGVTFQGHIVLQTNYLTPTTSQIRIGCSCTCIFTIS